MHGYQHYNFKRKWIAVQLSGNASFLKNSKYKFAFGGFCNLDDNRLAQESKKYRKHL